MLEREREREREVLERERKTEKEKWEDLFGLKIDLPRERERELCLSAKLVCFVCLFVSLVLYYVAGEYNRKPQPLD